MIQLLFILFMTIVSGAAFGIIKVGDHFQSKQKQELESCIMEQIELHEENRDSYFPKMRDELLHGFIMKCINDRTFRESTSLFRKSSSNDSSNRKSNRGETR